MKKLFLTLVIIFVLSGCSNSNSNTELSKDFLFQKNKECSQLRESLDQNAQEFAKSTGFNVEIRTLFYSPKENSCLFTRALTTLNNGIISDYETLINAYTWEKLYSVDSCDPNYNCERSMKEGEQEMSKKIATYK